MWGVFQSTDAAGTSAGLRGTSVGTSSWLLLVIQLHTNVERLSSCGVSSDTVERTQPSLESSVETNTLNCDVSRSGASVASTLGTTVPVMSDKILALRNSLTRVKKIKPNCQQVSGKRSKLINIIKKTKINQSQFMWSLSFKSNNKTPQWTFVSSAEGIMSDGDGREPAGTQHDRLNKSFLQNHRLVSCCCVYGLVLVRKTPYSVPIIWFCRHKHGWNTSLHLV